MRYFKRTREDDVVKAIVLSAGQGSRLLPLTADRPKCLIEIGGRSILEWQVRALGAAGVASVTVVVGFGAADVERHLRACRPRGMAARALFNPLFDRADNLVSCLAAAADMRDDFLLINGDTLFEPAVVSRLLASPADAVAVAVGRKPFYDADDMKVACRDGRITRIGKDLPDEVVSGEAIGLSLFRGAAPRAFLAALEAVRREPGGHRRWYLSAVDRLAARGLVRAASVDGLGWAEIDYPGDLPRAQALVAGWREPAPPVVAAVAETVTT
jgi:choline kinase